MPIGTDFLNGLERAKLIAQKTDVLVAPILLPRNAPFPHGKFIGKWKQLRPMKRELVA